MNLCKHGCWLELCTECRERMKAEVEGWPYDDPDRGPNGAGPTPDL